MRLLAELRAARGEVVSHERLQRVLGDRAPRYMEAMMCARTHLFVEAWRASGSHAEARAASRRLVSVKRVGYRLEPASES